MEGSLDAFIDRESLESAVGLLVRIVEAAAALIIFTGAVIAFFRFWYAAARRRRTEMFGPIRLDLGRFLAMGLEFQLASDILSTAVSPTFDELGKLAVVAAIRTALNYFLSREIRQEREELERELERLAEAARTP